MARAHQVAGARAAPLTKLQDRRVQKSEVGASARFGPLSRRFVAAHPFSSIDSINAHCPRASRMVQRVLTAGFGQFMASKLRFAGR
jgi:hypothetical protein